ncbi:hypothetical protein ACTU6V_09975 [Microbacterium sp. A204]|uniref:hypothetical protein n=1 Tax=Microbacterium sp. A204 TaxID=3457321 RepID=UPI003FD30A94
MSTRASRPNGMGGIARFLTVLIAVIAVAISGVAPLGAASASAAVSVDSSANLARTVGDTTQTGLVKTSLAGFSAGNIISDAVFTNKGTMSEAQVQSFLNSKVASCQSGYVCLKDLRTVTQSKSADSYCSGYSGSSSESAASIIYRVAQSCNINPQVLIVMLQKEQGLVTHTWPSDWRYNAAMGQACPDTAPCDTAFAGFFAQVYGAARQMQIYLEGRWFQWYKAGQTWQIQYHPDRARCGTGPVYIENKATEALYYYTPYQPNAAALAAGYGEGDSCGAYGNRNFYNYFTDWFGSTRSSGAQVMKDSSSGATYLVTQGKKYSFPTAERAVQFTWIAPMQTVSSAQLAAFPDGGVAPRAVRTDAGHVYLLDSGRRIWVPTCSRATDFGWECGSLPQVGQGQVSIYGDGGTLEPSITALGTSWLIQSGSRREVVDRSLLLNYGMSSGASAVSNAMASEYKLGDPVLASGVYSDGADGMRAHLNGGVYDISPEGQVSAVAAAAKRITKETWDRIASAGTLPLAAKVAGKTYLLSVNGWLQVDAYGSAVSFVDLPVSSLAGMPSVGSALGPHFVREQSGLQVFLVSGGTMQLADADKQRWITATFGVPSQVRVVADTVLGSRVAPAQRLVRTDNGTAYLIDGTNRYRFRDCGQVSDWGADCTQLATLSASEVAQYSDRGTLERLVRQTDGTTWLIQSGTRREVPDATVLAPFGIGPASSSVSTTLVRTLTVGSPVLGTGVYTDGGGAFLLSNPAGTFRAPAQLPVVAQTARRLTAESTALMPPNGDLSVRMLSDSRALLLTEQGWLQVDPALYGGTGAFAAAASAAWSGLPIVLSETRPHFVKDRASTQTFLVSGGTLQPVENDAARNWLAAYFGLSSRLWSLADGALKGVPLAPGVVVKTTDSRFMVTDGVTAYQLRDCAAVAAFGRDCASLPTVAIDVLALKDGGILTSLLQAPSGEKWLIQSGKRREVPDTTILAAYGIGSAATAVSAELLKTLPLGDPVVANGAYRSADGTMRLLVDGGMVLDVPTAAQVEVLKASAKALTDDSFALLKPSGTLPVRAESGGAAFVLSAQGWAQVDALNYGSLAFPSASAPVISALPAPAATGARFVREANSEQVYLASGGLTAMSADQQAWASAVYGVPSAVLVVADGVLR